MTILETPRLLLRVFEETDLDAFAAIEADPEVMRYFTSGPRSREHAGRGVTWFRELQVKYGYSLWAVVHKADNHFIGFSGLVPQHIDGNLEVEIGYKLAKAYWNQGLATEAARAVRIWAFQNLDVPHLISIIDLANVASQRVAEKTGMRYVRNVEYDGKACRIYMVPRQDASLSEFTNGALC